MKPIIIDEDTNNYRYDKVGRMISDDSARIQKITWTVTDKVDSVIKANGDTLHFTYDANGNRVMETGPDLGQGSAKVKFARSSVPWVHSFKPLSS